MRRRFLVIFCVILNVVLLVGIPQIVRASEELQPALKQAFLSLPLSGSHTWSTEADFSAGVFDNTRVVTDSVRLMQAVDGSHVLTGTYVSEVYDAGAFVNWGLLNYVANVPPDTTLTFYTRVGNVDLAQYGTLYLSDPHWTAWFTHTGTSVVLPHPSSRYIQYKVELGTKSVTTTPVLDEVMVTWDRLSCTEVGGTLNSDTTWHAANSPYLVASNLRVASGVTLTIEPGVTVWFGDTRILQIDGSLVARGTENQPITFTSWHARGYPGDWANISFSSTSGDATFDQGGTYVAGSVLQYVTVEYAGSWGFNEAIDASDTTLYVDHCTIRHNAADGIQVEGDGSYVTHNTIYDNSGDGIYNHSASYATIKGNVVYENHDDGIDNYYGYFANISDNIVEDNFDNGVLNGSSPYAVIKNNKITRNGEYGIYNYSGYHVSLESNSIEGNASGSIYWSSSSSGEIAYNTVVNNTTDGSTGGIYVSSQYPIIHHNIIYGNEGYALYNSNTDDPHLDARYNWWGTTDEMVIQNLIYDWYDDANHSVVDYDPFLFKPTPVLTISKTAPAVVTIDNPHITYTLAIANIGPAEATNLVVTDTIPSGAHYVSGGQRSGAEVRWMLARLPAYAKTQVSFVVTATETLTNSQYRVTASDNVSATGETPVATVFSIPLESVTIDGSSEGMAYLEQPFVAEVQPVSATLPITYTWWLGSDYHQALTTWTPEGSNSSWAFGEPTTGPACAHTDSQVWATDLHGDYNNYENSTLTSPEIDLTAASSGLVLEWWQWLETESWYDDAIIEVRGGTIDWTMIYQDSGTVDQSWTRHTADISQFTGLGDVQVRFRLDSDGSGTYWGWYVDDIAIRAANVSRTGGLSDTVDLVWNVPGAYTLTLEASNANNSVSDTHEITINPLSYMTVSEDITQNTIWTRAASPYLVTENVLVSQGVTLTIEPGVIVWFSNERGLRVQGTLLAKGTAAQPIQFSARLGRGQPGIWGGLAFGETAVGAVFDQEGHYLRGSILQYVTVEYAGAVSFDYAVDAVSTAVYVDHCLIHHNSAGGLRVGGDETYITNNTVHNNSGTAIYNSGDWVTVRGNTIYDNYYRGIYNYYGYNSVISDNTIRDNYDDGIYNRYSSDVTVMRNIIRGNTYDGIYNYASRDLVISYNDVSGNYDDGIYNYYGSGAVISHNAVNDNADTGVYNSSSFDVNIRYNTIRGNADRGIYWYSSANTGTIAYNSILSNTADYDSTGGIYINQGYPDIYYNIIQDNEGYLLYNDNDYSEVHLNARYNWWGTKDGVTIPSLIYDWYDDANRSIVDYEPFLRAGELSQVYLPVMVRDFFGTGTLGFNSQFNGSAFGWEVHSGVWTIGDNYYSTYGLYGYVSSISYIGQFANFDYQVRLWRSGCDTCANRIIVRGAPYPLDSYDNWCSGYLFQYTTDGSYSVWKVVEDYSDALQYWTYSDAINQGDAWNTLRVVAYGSSLSYYINDTLVWSGADTSLTSGRVGIGMYKDSFSAGDRFLVDWATLSSFAGKRDYHYSVSDEISAEQQRLNVLANEHPSGDVRMASKEGVLNE